MKSQALHINIALFNTQTSPYYILAVTKLPLFYRKIKELSPTCHFGKLYVVKSIVALELRKRLFQTIKNKTDILQFSFFQIFPNLELRVFDENVNLKEWSKTYQSYYFYDHLYKHLIAIYCIQNILQKMLKVYSVCWVLIAVSRCVLLCTAVLF